MAEKQINITLNVDDELFNKLIEDGIESLPKDKLDTILLDGIKNSFKQHVDLELKSANGYSNFKSSKLLSSVMEKLDIDKYFGEIIDTVSKNIKDNHENLIMKALAQTIAAKIFSSNELFSLQNEFYNHLSQTMTNY
jgi:hypothetical protein